MGEAGADMAEKPEASALPLNGITVLDFSWLLPGPFCTMQLADLGADVIKIESPQGDYAREMLPGLFAVVNRNKRSLTIDLKAPGALALIDDMMPVVDVVIVGFRPGVADRLGIGYERLSGINPKIVYASISGFGAHGPDAQRPGHDINYLAMSGVLSIPGQWGEQPARSGLPVADIAGAMNAALSIVACLFESRITGRGRYLDVGMLPSLLNWSQVRMADYLESAQGTWPHLNPLNDLFETKDGKRVSLALVEPKFFEAFCYLAECQGLLNAPQYKSFSQDHDLEAGQYLRDRVQQIISERTANDWTVLFQDQSIPFAPVLSSIESLDNPQLKACGFDNNLPDGIPKGYFPYPVPELASKNVRPAPSQGEHTREIMRAFGVEPVEIDRLFAEGVVS